MKDFARRKQYVEVVATHYIDGSVRPQKIVLATGPVYEIEDSRTAGRRLRGRLIPPGNWPGAMW